MNEGTKRAYSTPKLTSFGSIAQLTQNHQGSAVPPGAGTVIVRRGYANVYGRGPGRRALPIGRTGGPFG
jgi:hypothetical protein